MKPLTAPAILFWQEAQCPACAHSGGIRYSMAPRGVRCAACGWTVTGLLPKIHNDLMRDKALNRSVDSVLRLLATQAGPVGDKPPTVITERVGNTFKAHVLPDPDEAPEARLERLAGQFSLNGGTLDCRNGAILATSQRRDGETLAPARIYRLTRTGFTWACDCPATGPCAHLAGLWAHYSEAVAAPRWWEAARQIARQVGVYAPPAIAWAVAMDDLY